MSTEPKDLTRKKYTLSREYFHYFSGKGALYDVTRSQISPSSLYVQLMQSGDHGEDIRLFTFFSSYLEFLNYLEKVPRKSWNFNEMIVGNRPQKLKYDIDASLGPLPGESLEIATKRNDALVEEVKDRLVEAILEEFPQLRIDRDILIYKSDKNQTGEVYKASMHIVVNHIAFSDYLEVQAVFNAIKQRIGDDFEVLGVPIWTQRIIDPSVNSKNQNFRCLGCHKPGKFNTKRLYTRWLYRGDWIHLKREEHLLSEEHQWIVEFSESLVSNVTDCVLQPNRVSQEERERLHQRRKKSTVIGDGSDELVMRCIDLLSDKVQEEMSDCFDVYSMEEHDNNTFFIQLLRLVPTLCPICSERGGGAVYHDRQNPYFRIRDHQVFFSCHRAFDSQMRRIEMLLGSVFLPVEKDPLIKDILVEEPTATRSPQRPFSSSISRLNSPKKAKARTDFRQLLKSAKIAQRIP